MPPQELSFLPQNGDALGSSDPYRAVPDGSFIVEGTKPHSIGLI